MKPIIAALSVLLVTACASAEPDPRRRDSVVFDPADFGVPRGARSETLYAIHAGKEGLRLRVPSNGCTTKDHIKVVLLPPLPNNPPYDTIMVFRVKPDTCQSLVMGSAWVEFSYEELGVTSAEKFRVGGLLTPWTGPGE